MTEIMAIVLHAMKFLLIIATPVYANHVAKKLIGGMSR